MTRSALLAIPALLLTLTACQKSKSEYTFDPSSPANPSESGDPMTFVFCDSGGNLSVYTGSMSDFHSNSLQSAASPLNGQACQNSTNDSYTLYSMSQATQAGVIPGSSSPAPSRAAAAPASGRISLVNTFPAAMPVPFGPPLFASGTTPPSPTCDPTGAIYAVEHFSAAVLHLGTCPLHLITTIPVASHPLQARLTPDASTLIVTSYDSAINFIDTASDQVVYTLNTSPNIRPSGLAISPDGKLAYVTSYFNVSPSLLIINIASRSITNSVPLGNFPKSLLLTPDGAQLWIEFWEANQLAVYDTLTLTQIGTVTADGLAYSGMTFNSTATKAYITTTANTVDVIDTATLRNLAQIPVVHAPAGITLSPTGSFLLVTSQTSSSLSVIDAQSDVLVGTLPVNAPGAEIALAP